MGEGVRHHASLTLLLEAIITDCAGGIQGFFDIAGLQPFQTLLRMIGPDPGQAVGLQLLADRCAEGATPRASVIGPTPAAPVPGDDKGR